MIDQIRGLGVGDPDLPTVERVASVVEPCHGLLVRRVGSGVLFRQREGAQRLTARQPPEPQLLLRVGTESRNRLDDERIVDRGNHRDDRARARQRFDRERVADVVLAGAAPFGADRHAHQAERRELAHEVARERALVVNRRRLRRDDDPLRTARRRPGTPSVRQ